MAFWSGEKLAARLPSLVQPFTVDNLDCASYRLSVGEQVFVTSDKFQTGAPTDPLVSFLTAPPANILRIHPGQFAFLLTEEEVKVPNIAIALISMRAGYKFKGLINVSGFHVDPGWSGKLLFTVYNAGPAEIIVRRGEPMFLIVFADLDQATKETYKPKAGKQMAIKTELLQNMTEQVFSPQMLQRRMNELDKRMASVEGTAVSLRGVTVGVTAAVGLLIAGAALFAAFAPSTLGVIVGKLIENGGYEMKFKVTEIPKLADPQVQAPQTSAPPKQPPTQSKDNKK